LLGKHITSHCNIMVLLAVAVAVAVAVGLSFR
jgi:hypothetical protein